LRCARGVEKQAAAARTMRTLAVAACLAAAVAADPERLGVAVDSGVTPMTELRGADRSLSTETEDPMCDAAQTILRNSVEAECNVTDVVCVYKGDGDCDDWCSPSFQCGYIPHNPFLQSHDSSCVVTATSPVSVTGSVTCHPQLTAKAIALLVAAAVVLCGCCCCTVWCCCCRRRRR